MIKNGKSLVIKNTKINMSNGIWLHYKITTKMFSTENQKSKNKSFDPYLVLDINRKATWAEIKKQYYKLARQYHPDLNKNDEVSLKFNYLSVLK